MKILKYQKWMINKLIIRYNYNNLMINNQKQNHFLIIKTITPKIHKEEYYFPDRNIKD